MLSREDVSFLLDKIRKAGQEALEISARTFKVELKSDESPVTEADHHVSKCLDEALAERFPNDLVISEEHLEIATREVSRVWFIDPIDGTKDFIHKNGEWSVIVGLAVENNPVFGAVYQPQNDILYYGMTGNGSYRREKSSEEKIHVKNVPDFSECRLVSSRNHPHPNTEALIEKLGIKSKYIHGSVGLKVCQVAEGRADLYFNLGGKANAWDLCGPDAILREAGGMICTERGETVTYSRDKTKIDFPYFAISKSLQPKLVEELEKR
jgi:3'(2'), 5'-bisphosphate nucleotidase